MVSFLSWFAASVRNADVWYGLSGGSQLLHQPRAERTTAGGGRDDHGLQLGLDRGLGGELDRGLGGEPYGLQLGLDRGLGGEPHVRAKALECEGLTGGNGRQVAVAVDAHRADVRPLFAYVHQDLAHGERSPAEQTGHDGCPSSRFPVDTHKTMPYIGQCQQREGEIRWPRRRTSPT